VAIRSVRQDRSRRSRVDGVENSSREQSSLRNWQLQEMARNELGVPKKTSCVILNESETVINPLPGYD
jgi:hypothetical protein